MRIYSRTAAVSGVFAGSAGGASAGSGPAGPAGPAKIRLRVPVEQENAVEILGEGPAAAPRVVEVLRRLGFIA